MNIGTHETSDDQDSGSSQRDHNIIVLTSRIISLEFPSVADNWSLHWSCTILATACCLYSVLRIDGLFYDPLRVRWFSLFIDGCLLGCSVHVCERRHAMMRTLPPYHCIDGFISWLLWRVPVRERPHMRWWCDWCDGVGGIPHDLSITDYISTIVSTKRWCVIVRSNNNVMVVVVVDRWSVVVPSLYLSLDLPIAFYTCVPYTF